MKKISGRTITRALLYIRTLETLLKDKKDSVSSGELARITGLTDVQIRKDISSFGKVGTPRVGYDVRELRNKLENFVLQKKEIRVVLFGVGNLGTAILKYPWLRKGKLKVIAAFDTSGSKAGKTINGVSVYPAEKAPAIIKQSKAELGIVAVPEDKGQDVADIMVKAGLKGIANFAPVSLKVPKHVIVRNIDLSIEFLSLFCDTQTR